MAILTLASACERRSALAWLRNRGAGKAPPPIAPGSLPLGVIDCPDGLARCSEGTVEVSRLAGIVQPCQGAEGACACPWERAALCVHGCVAEGVEVVVDRQKAAVQLCALDYEAGLRVPTGVQSFGACDDAQLYRCNEGLVVDCAAHVIAASCMHGCFADGAVIDESAGPVTREAAFAILCSR